MENAASHSPPVHPFNELADSVDDLLKRISDVDSPDVRKIRTKVQIALAVARSAWQDAAHYANQRVANSLHRPSDYVHESPWRAVGLATMLGVGLGALLSRSRGH